MNQTTDFAKLYCDVILKKIVSKIVADQKRKVKAESIAMKTAETAGQVRTMRHWRAAADNEFYYAEIEKGFQQMKELDELTGWSRILHQDRFKFMREKFGNVLSEYLQEDQP